MRRSQQSQRIKVSEFKVHLGQYLRIVRAGGEITVLDRETPVAKLVPFIDETKESVEITPPISDWFAVDEKWLHASPPEQASQLSKSSLDYLTEDRE